MTTGVPPLLLLSDVDGTLLGDDGALPVPASQLRAVLARTARQWAGGLQVGLASSRTLRELAVLQRALALPGPCIAEDGARHAIDSSAVVDHAVRASAQGRERHGRRLLLTWQHAAPATVLRKIMADEPRIARADTQRQSAAQLAALGFRTPGAVRRALVARTHSVLLDPHAWSSDDLTDLRAHTAARGLQLRRGGRWFTLTMAGGKGPALRALRHHCTVRGVPPLIVAIGNEENDQSLLAEADCRFVIRNPQRGAHPALSSLPGAVVLDTEGPGGWMEMLDRLVPCAQELLAARALGASR
jgi:mannosyl-3-phosphoglycerate phosphatase